MTRQEIEDLLQKIKQLPLSTRRRMCGHVLCFQYWWKLKEREVKEMSTSAMGSPVIISEMVEDKQYICNLLLYTLRATRYAHDLAALEYQPEKGQVEATWESGAKRYINVAMDSGYTMIRDIMKHL